MKAYHLKTRASDSHDALGVEQYELNSIYVPEKQVLAGYILFGKNNGLIINYSKIQHERAQCIVEGNKNDVRGDVISELDLSEDIVEKIFRTKNESEIKVTKQYDGSTDTLVGILSGEYHKRNLIEKISAYFRKN